MTINVRDCTKSELLSYIKSELYNQDLNKNPLFRDLQNNGYRIFLHYSPTDETIVFEAYALKEKDFQSSYLYLKVKFSGKRILNSPFKASDISLAKYSLSILIDIFSFSLCSLIIKSKASLEYLKYVHSVSVLDDPIYCHIFNKNGLGQQQAGIEAMKYHDAVFSKIISSLNELEVSNNVVMLSYEMIIQILANYVGKLYKAGYSKEKIYVTISAYPWYEKILSHKYSTVKSNLRKVLLSIRKYWAISLIFRK